MTSDSASRVTRSSRSLRLILLLFAGLLAGQAVLRAQESPGPPAVSDSRPAAAPSQPEAAVAPADGAEDADVPRAAEEATATVPAPTGPSPGRFEPTEKVRADFDVSFPIDI